MTNPEESEVGGDRSPELDGSPDRDAAPEHKEPGLGPACLVVSILLLAVMCSVCAFGSWFMFSDQYPLAVKGINVQLIPWVQSSQLSNADKQSITADLEELIPLLEDRQINNQQLTRLHNCLQDNAVLLWGGIESIIAQAPAAGLSDTEQEALVRVSQRLLRAATERKLSRNDLEFTIQNCSKVRPGAQSLDVISPLTAEQIREFVTRAEQIVVRNEIPNEPFEKTPAEAFRTLIDAALKVDPE